MFRLLKLVLEMFGNSVSHDAAKRVALRHGRTIPRRSDFDEIRKERQDLQIESIKIYS